MNKIQKNLNSLEFKLNSLKTAFKLHNHPTPMAQVASIITQGAITQKDAQEYLNHINGSPLTLVNQRINQKWYQLNLEQMLAFLDKVALYRDQNTINDSQKKITSTPSPQKKKIKAPMSQVHQNPFIPSKITHEIKNQYQPNSISRQINFIQNNVNKQKEIKQKQQPGYYSSLLLLKSKSLKQPQKSSIKSISKVKQIIPNLPENFQNLSPTERYAILKKKYGKDKCILEKKLDMIYKYYRKQMYIPFQSFEINNQLLMDLRIFLKYYRQFQISNVFKTNDAIQYFKKLAINGIWLDDKKFIEIHYKLVQLLDIDENQCQQESNNDNVNTETDFQKVNEKYSQKSRKMNNLVEKILKIKELLDLVSQNKIKQIFNNKDKPNTVKRIVQAHSGLTKDEVALRLQERVELRNFKKQMFQENLIRQKSIDLSPTKRNLHTDGNLQDLTKRLSLKKRSIYDQLEIPKLRSRELKKSSVYLSLQMMNIQKEREKLKKLINQKENEQYLDAFFKRQKEIFNLPRTKSVTLSKNQVNNQESASGFTTNSVKSIKHRNKQSVLSRNFSLPRMKFN